MFISRDTCKFSSFCETPGQLADLFVPKSALIDGLWYFHNPFEIQRETIYRGRNITTQDEDLCVVADVMMII